MSIQQLFKHRLTCDGRDRNGDRAGNGKPCPTPPVVVETVGAGESPGLPMGWTAKHWREDHPEYGPGRVVAKYRHYCPFCAARPETQEGPAQDEGSGATS